MLDRLTRLAIEAPWRIVVAAIVLTAAFGVLAAPVAQDLSAGGAYDPDSESVQAAEILEQKFGHSRWQTLITVSAEGDVLSGAGREVGTDIVDQLSRSPHTASVTSPWGRSGATAGLVSNDGTAALIVVTVTGTESEAPQRAKALTELIDVDRDDVTVRVGGLAMYGSQIAEQTVRDLLIAEAIAIPLCLVVLVWVFGGLVAAALPIAVAMIAIVGSTAALRMIALTTEVTSFALNLGVGLSMALAIDYTLLILSRYRDEKDAGADLEHALRTTMRTAGRTVAFSAATVALAMASLLLFPMGMLKSLAYAGVAVVGFAALAALVVAPAAIVLLGDRLMALDLRQLARRVLRRSAPPARDVTELFFYRSTKFVMRHAVPFGIGTSALLILFGLPFLDLRPGTPDDRVLPTSMTVRQVGDQLREDFARDESAAVIVVIPDASRISAVDFDGYAAALSLVPDVTAVASPTGTYVAGMRAGPPSGSAGIERGSAYLTVQTAVAPLSTAAGGQLDRIRAVNPPGGQLTLLGGAAQVNRDNVAAVVEPLPWVLTFMALTIFVLMFVLTGSVVVPIKALTLGVLSLTATFGALVWIFQENHLGALGTTSTGTLPLFVLIPLFCFAFALSMDYEVFLVSRIREYWLASGRTAADNEESVALGLARTGRVITAAALLLAIPFAAQMAAQVSFIRVLGLGLVLAMLVDATLIRLILLPVFMKLLGRWNWWAPAPLVRLHGRWNRLETTVQVTPSH